jgi:ribosomal protein S12 methylthiotransferase accessory factor
MIDVTRTLAKSAGVAVRFSLVPPQATNPLWTTAVELPPVAGMDVDEIPMSARMVGANGHSRADALMRGAGEAVERFALHPGPGLPSVRGRAADLELPALAVHEPQVALGAPATANAVLSWLPGRRLRDGEAVMVPAALVDWPSMETESALFDPGPSGAAAGSTPQMALRSALLEMVERDAVIGAWERGLQLPAYIDPEQIVPAGPADQQARAALIRLWERAQAWGIAPTLARIPTAVPGLWCIVGSLVDPAGPQALATVGLKVSDRPWDALLGAFQEAWQVRTALELSRAGSPPADPTKTIVTEHDRIHYMLTAEGYQSVRDWVAGFKQAVEAPPVRKVSNEDILHAVLADGGDPVAVDLTARLSPVLQGMGWCAVKVLPVGYQHLRMDERHRWSWNAPRLESAARRTGCEARYHGGSAARPHPLP